MSFGGFLFSLLLGALLAFWFFIYLSIGSKPTGVKIVNRNGKYYIALKHEFFWRKIDTTAEFSQLIKDLDELSMDELTAFYSAAGKNCVYPFDDEEEAKLAGELFLKQLKIK